MILIKSVYLITLEFEDQIHLLAKVLYKCWKNWMTQKLYICAHVHNTNNVKKKKKIEEVNKKSNVGSLLTGCFKILLYHYKVKWLCVESILPKSFSQFSWHEVTWKTLAWRISTPLQGSPMPVYLPAPILNLGGERHCGSYMSCLRTQGHDPDHSWTWTAQVGVQPARLLHLSPLWLLCRYKILATT